MTTSPGLVNGKMGGRVSRVMAALAAAVAVALSLVAPLALSPAGAQAAYADDALAPAQSDLLMSPQSHGDLVASGSCGDSVTWSLYEDGHLSIEGEGDMGSVGTGEGSYRYYQYRSSITSAFIADGVTSISGSAFEDCTSLTSVEIPSSVTYIGSGAFSNCATLASVDIPSSVTSIGREVFWGCTSLASVEIPSSVTSIGWEAFGCCSSLASVDIPSSVTKIDWYAFHDCTSLTSIDIPSSVTYIGGSAFSNCTSLASVDIPSSVTSIDGRTFEGCTSLASAEIPASVTSIGDSAFSGCTSLASVSIPSSVVSIGECAFEGCTSLVSVDIPSSVASIGERAFYNCESLSDVRIEGESVTIGKEAFAGLADGSVIYVKNARVAFLARANCDLGKTTVVDSTAVEPPDAYLVDSGTCGDNVTWSLYGDGHLSIEGEGDMWDSAFSDECYLQYASGITSATVAEGVTSIAGDAFRDCTSLASVEIPASVTSIGSYAFGGCASLASVGIPSAVALIGDGAFMGCASLTSVELPSLVTSIGYGTFDGCAKLVSVGIPSSVTSIDEHAFSGCASLVSVDIPSSVVSIGRYVFDGCASLASVEIPASVASIGSYAFRGCTMLTTVEIPSSVTSIGEGAFRDCTSLASVEIPSSVAKISIYAFYGCKSLATVHIGGESVSVGRNAFSGLASGSVVYVLNDAVASAVRASCDSWRTKVVVGVEKTDISGASVMVEGPFVYTGEAVEPVPSVSLGGEVLVKGTDYDVSYENNVDAGTATITVTGTGDYEGETSATFEIAKAPSAVSLADASAAYTGQPLAYAGTPTVSGSAGEVTVRYYSDAECASPIDASEVVGAGVYYVRATLAADANHEGAESAPARFTVGKAASSIKLAAQSKTYTGKKVAYPSSGATVTGSTGKVTFKYYSDSKCTKQVAATKVVGAGTYYVKGTVAADANHKAATSKVVKLTVKKADNTLAVKAKAASVAYSKTAARTVEASKWCAVSKAQGKVTYKKSSTDNAGITVASNGKITVKKGLKQGSYTIKVKVTAAGNANYKAATKTVSVKVTVK